MGPDREIKRRLGPGFNALADGLCRKASTVLPNPECCCSGARERAASNQLGPYDIDVDDNPRSKGAWQQAVVRLSRLRLVAIDREAPSLWPTLEVSLEVERSKIADPQVDGNEQRDEQTIQVKCGIYLPDRPTLQGVFHQLDTEVEHSLRGHDRWLCAGFPVRLASDSCMKRAQPCPI